MSIEITGKETMGGGMPQKQFDKAAKAVGKLILLLCVLFMIPGCSWNSHTSGTEIEMELTQNYSPTDSFIHEKLFYVQKSVDTLKLNISFRMEGESGTLEIADNETEEVLWSETWNENTEITKFVVSLNEMDKDKEYVVRFTGTKIQYAKIVVTSEDKLIRERTRPGKPK